ncbi:AbrB family transcriptional regulator [Corynebacterium sp. CNJ-954]|nr:AbrB family transcriptional regulator [Corynebacterium sp. CNJ-954]
MRINAKGQVTIPAELRRKFGIREGDDVEVIEDGGTLRIVHSAQVPSRGELIVSKMRGQVTTARTDALMKLLRDTDTD